MSKPLNESLGQKVVTKWVCRRTYSGDYIVKSEEFRVTDKMFVMLRPEEQSNDSQTAFEYSTRFHHVDQRLSDSVEQAINKLVKAERDSIEIFRGKIAKSKERIVELSRFFAQWKLINPK